MEGIKWATFQCCGRSGTANTETAFAGSGMVPFIYSFILFYVLFIFILSLYFLYWFDFNNLFMNIGKGVTLGEFATRVCGSSDLYSLDTGTLHFAFCIFFYLFLYIIQVLIS